MVNRTPVHNRTIDMKSFLLDDGTWEFEASLLDTKSYDFTTSKGVVKKSGTPIHDMSILVKTTADGEIVDAKAHYDVAPYGQICKSIEEAYKSLIGLHLLKHFRSEVKKRFARTAGCTHMSELVVQLPTVYVQSLAKQRKKERQQKNNRRPFQLEGCHAYALHSPVVKEFYPQWYVPKKEQVD